MSLCEEEELPQQQPQEPPVILHPETEQEETDVAVVETENGETPKKVFQSRPKPLEHISPISYDRYHTPKRPVNGDSSDVSRDECLSPVSDMTDSFVYDQTPRSYYLELSPSSRRRKSRQMRVNRTNEFTESIMARPLWKDELTHETRQLLMRKRELEKQYDSKKYIVDRRGNIRDTKKLSEEKKALLDKYTELSKMIVSPRAEKKKEDKDSFAFFRRMKYHDDIVKDRNEAIVAKEKERSIRIQEEIKLKEQEEELKKRQEKEETKRKKMAEKRRRESQKKQLHVLTHIVGDLDKSTSKRLHEIKIDYPKPKVLKVNPQKEAELHRLEQKRIMLEKRQKLLAPSQKALKEKYKAPKVLFLKETPKIEPPRPRMKYVPPPKKRQAKKTQPQKTESVAEKSDLLETPQKTEEQAQETSEERDEQKFYLEDEHRMYIMEEILTTERKYVTLLKEIFEVYAAPIQKNGLLSSDLYRLVFNDLNVIMLLNQQFLDELETTYQQYLGDVKNGIASSLIGHLFKRRSPTFKLYTNYINNYEQSLQVIEEQTERSKAFRLFRKSASRGLIESGSHNTDLSSYMILPVQRIPRYQLLLRDLIKHTPKEHPEYNALIEAHDSIVEIASYCNKKKAEALNIFKVVELAEELKIKGLVQPGRTIVKVGEVRRAKSKKMTKLFLFNDLLVIVEKGLLNKVIQIPLPISEGEEDENVMANETPDSPCPDTDNSTILYLRAPELGYQRNFICENKRDRDEWVQAIESAQSTLSDYNSDSKSPKRKIAPRKGLIRIFGN